MHPILATDTASAAYVVIGTCLAFLVVTALGFWAATRGHWSTLIFATPGLLLGGTLAAMLVHDLGAFDFIALLFLIPPGLAVASIVLWYRRRNAKKPSPHEKPIS